LKYCKNCLDPNTRPRTSFNKEGVCFACETFDKDKIEYSYNNRLRIFNEIIKIHKSKDNYFDCILGVSGGKDSTRQAIWLRDKFNLNPLLVCCSYPPEQVTDEGAQNLSNLIDHGFNVIISAPAPGFWKKSLKKSFYKGNYLIGPEIALYSSVPQIAIKYGIKLIFWGENPALVWNDKKTNLKFGYDGNALRNSNTLNNCDISWLKNIDDQKSHLIPYKYPSRQEFKKHNLQIIYLSWFWKNWTFINNAKYSCLNGLELKRANFSKTGDLFGITAIDDTWVSINQMIKYYKFGFGRVTDLLNFEIRYGNISREIAIKHATKYDGKCSKSFIRNFCKYLDISEKDFNNQLLKIVNKKIFKIIRKKNSIEIKKKFIVGKGL
tara:strand:+ start:1844 stop:2980 length:1137 start_codon:yes stop_codon:yes gene_type:complete